MAETTLVDRAVLRLSGTDVRGFLQGLVTNDMTELAPGRPLWAALLSAQGKALFDFILWADGGDVLIDAEAAHADPLIRRLTLYRLRKPVSIALDPVTHVHWSADGETGAPDPRLPALGRRWLGDADAPARGYHRRRIALGVAEGAAELGVDKTLWLECNAVELDGVSFTKGCYVGQENTARMHHRDKLRRRLLPVTIQGDPGAEIEIRSGARVAGELRSNLDRQGIAWLRLEHIDGELTVGDARLTPVHQSWLPENGTAELLPM